MRSTLKINLSNLAFRTLSQYIYFKYFMDYCLYISTLLFYLLFLSNASSSTCQKPSSHFMFVFFGIIFNLLFLMTSCFNYSLYTVFLLCLAPQRIDERGYFNKEIDRSIH